MDDTYGALMEARLHRFMDAWNSHDVVAIVDLFRDYALVTDDFVIIDPNGPAGSRTFGGKEDIRRFAEIAAPGFHGEVWCLLY